MLEIGMHKHIRNKLRRIKIGRKEKMQSQQILHIDAITSCYNCAEEAQYINNQQIFCYCRNGIHIYIILFMFYNTVAKNQQTLRSHIK